MFRMIGAVLIISATAAWGFTGVMRLRSHVASLLSLQQSLELMQSEICDNLTPLPELFELLEKASGNPASAFYKNLTERMKNIGEMPFPEIWSSTIMDTQEIVLNAQETLVLSKLGYSLGKYDKGAQKAAIVYTYESLKHFREKAELDMVRDSKVRAFTGIAAGVFTVIILA